MIARPDTATVYVLAGTIEGVFQEHTVLIDVLANDVSTAGERWSIVSIDFHDWNLTGPTPEIVELTDVDRQAILYTGVAPRELTDVVRNESNRQDTGLVTSRKADPRFPTADPLLPAGFSRRGSQPPCDPRGFWWERCQGVGMLTCPGVQ